MSDYPHVPLSTVQHVTDVYGPGIGYKRHGILYGLYKGNHCIAMCTAVLKQFNLDKNDPNSWIVHNIPFNP